MKMRRLALLNIIAVFMLTSLAAAQYNPCGGKKKGMNACNPCNPCAKKTMFKFDDPMGRNSVVFKSEAPLEDIVGTSNEIKGWIKFDPMHPDKGVMGELTVPTGSFNTGIPLRNKHLQSSDWLDAQRHPNITLKIKKVKNLRQVKASSDFKTYTGDVVAELNFHGKKKTITFPGKLTYLKESKKTKMKMPGDLVAAKGSFDVKLADFGVTGPKGMGIVGSKVGETVSIEVSLVGTNASMAMAGNPCNPCGGKKGMMNPCNPCGGKHKMNPCNPCGGKHKMNPCGR
ncbi:MAG: YceI family protein [Candidatus Zixiibacteriota bacterium]|nr:MAG: YceI family protein [candidate division Zixibacteria bacterium]